MANFLDVLNQSIGKVGDIAGSVGETLRKLGIHPQTALGLGLTGLGATQGDLPGFANEAVQFLRNQFTSPTALSEDLTGQLQGLSDRFQPLLTQQRQLDLGDIQQRYAAAFPTRVGAQPSEFKGLADYITRTALPREQGLLTNLGLGLVERQSRSAEDLLNFAKPNPIAGALGQLGGLLTFGDALRGGGMGTTIGAKTLSLSQFPPFLASAAQAIGGVLGATISGGSRNSEGGFDLRDSLGQTIATILVDGTVIDSRTGIPMGKVPVPSGQVGQPPTSPEGFPNANLPQLGQGTSTGLSQTPVDFRGLLSTLQGLGSVSTSPTGEGAPGMSRIPGLIGTGVGAIAGHAIGGALAGAEGGSVIPGIGTAIGALVGFLGGGAFAKSASARAQKGFRRTSDIESQSGQEQEIGSFFSAALQHLGADTTAYEQFVKDQLSIIEAGATDFSFQGITGHADQQEAVSTVGGKLLLKAIQAQDPRILSLDQVPGLRQAFINHLLQTTRLGSGETLPSGLLEDFAIPAGLG